MRIKFKKLHPEARIPTYAHEGDAGMDLFEIENYILKAGERRVIGTGIAIEIPDGYVGLVWDKSGLAAHHGIKTMGGVIDASYRGEIKIVLLNTSDKDFKIEKGMKIAQLLIQPVVSAEIEEVSELSGTHRSDGGFGSTGK